LNPVHIFGPQHPFPVSRFLDKRSRGPGVKR
jgi:hypothetical protein